MWGVYIGVVWMSAMGEGRCDLAPRCPGPPVSVLPPATGVQMGDGVCVSVCVCVCVRGGLYNVRCGCLQWMVQRVGVDVVQHHDVQAPQSLCCLLQQGYSWVMEWVKGGGVYIGVMWVSAMDEG